MTERIIRAFAGTLILTSILLAFFLDIRWLFVTVFVGANLLQSSLTKFCPLERILNKVNVKRDKHRHPEK